MILACKIWLREKFQFSNTSKSLPLPPSTADSMPLQAQTGALAAMAKRRVPPFEVREPWAISARSVFGLKIFGQALYSVL